MYDDDENLVKSGPAFCSLAGSSATEDSSIVTFDSLLVLKEHAKVTVGSVRFQTSLSCNASDLSENKVTNESDGILM